MHTGCVGGLVFFQAISLSRRSLMDYNTELDSDGVLGSHGVFVRYFFQ